jgi:hypothetical protein
MDIIKHYDIKLHVFLDGIILYSEMNPILGKFFQLFCNITTTVASTITIGTPDGTVVGSCTPASSLLTAKCTDAFGYDASLNESAGIVTLNIISLASDVTGNWTCTHNSVTGRWPLSTITGNFNVHVKFSLLYSVFMLYKHSMFSLL